VRKFTGLSNGLQEGNSADPEESFVNPGGGFPDMEKYHQKPGDGFPDLRNATCIPGTVRL